MELAARGIGILLVLLLPVLVVFVGYMLERLIAGDIPQPEKEGDKIADPAEHNGNVAAWKQQCAVINLLYGAVLAVVFFLGWGYTNSTAYTPGPGEGANFVVGMITLIAPFLAAGFLGVGGVRLYKVAARHYNPVLEDN